ncbi:MAG: PAS domain-containing sensor histidine kinase [Bacteroidota bacterium]
MTFLYLSVFFWNNYPIAIIIILIIGFIAILSRQMYNKNKKKKIIEIIKKESLYRTLFDNTGTSTILIDKSFKIILANTEFEKLSAYSKQEIEKELFFKSLIHSSDQQKVEDFFSQNNLRQDSTYIQIRIINKHGQKKNCLCKFAEIKGSNQFVVSLTDITEQIQNEIALNESRKQLGAILNAIPNLIFTINNDGIIVAQQKHGNRNFSFFMREPKNGINISELFPKQISEEVVEHKNKSHTSKQNNKFEFSLNDAEKNILHFEAQFISIGKDLLLFIMQDITDRIETEKTIRILGHAVRGVSECINITDEHNIIQFVNQAFLNTYGYKEEEVIGKNVNMIVSKNNSEDLLNEIKSARLKGSWHGEVLNKKKSGEEFPVYLSTSLVKDNESKTIAIFAVSLDITERIKQTNAISKLNKELSEKNKELEQIIYIASHDLRSPLINIEGFSYELSRLSKSVTQSLTNEETDKLKEIEQLYNFIAKDMPNCIEYITISTKKMDSLIAGLLKISRLGKDPLNITRIDMNQLIENVVKNFSFQINKKNAQINIDNLPAYEGDFLLLNQLFSNIISNAIKYSSHNRTPLIEIGGYKNNETNIYYVKDNGSGIPENKIDDIFKIFMRLNNDDSGDGLGLSIVKKIVNRHSGKVWVTNNENQGVTFYIELPVFNAAEI